MSVDLRKQHAAELFTQSLLGLQAVIAKEQDLIRAQQRSKLELLPDIETAALRFVHCGGNIPQFRDTLEYRSTYLASATAAGTPFQVAHRAFLGKTPRPSRRRPRLSQLLKQLKEAKYKQPRTLSDLKGCIKRLALCRNELPIGSPLAPLLDQWQLATGDVLDLAELWAVDGCRYLQTIGTKQEVLCERIESQQLDAILKAATKLAEDVLKNGSTLDSGNGQTPSAAVAKRRGRKPKRDEPQFRKVLELHSKGNGPKAIVGLTGYSLTAVNRYLSRERRRRKRAANN